jgi:hypothetical protein
MRSDRQRRDGAREAQREREREREKERGGKKQERKQMQGEEEEEEKAIGMLRQFWGNDGKIYKFKVSCRGFAACVVCVVWFDSWSRYAQRQPVATN